MTEKQRRMLYLQEMEGMAQIAKSMMEDISHVQTSFIQATHIQHAKPMFKVIVNDFFFYCKFQNKFWKQKNIHCSNKKTLEKERFEHFERQRKTLQQKNFTFS